MRVSRNSDEEVSWRSIILVGMFVASLRLLVWLDSALSGLDWYIKIPIHAAESVVYFEVILVVTKFQYIVSKETTLFGLLFEGLKPGLPMGLFFGVLGVVWDKWPGWTGLGFGTAVAAFVIWALLSNRADDRAKTRIADGESGAE